MEVEILRINLLNLYFLFNLNLVTTNRNTFSEKLVEKYAQQQALITFEEDQSYGYKTRTDRNASADITLAFAMDFTTGGEILTKNSVLGQNKIYIPIDINEMSNQTVHEFVKLNLCNVKTLNIAGNGLYTMKNKYTQLEIDTLMLDFLKTVLPSDNQIELIRSGGQSGFDEAGIKAAIKLGIKALVLAPKGWMFRNIDGVDIRDENLFKNRFITI